MKEGQHQHQAVAGIATRAQHENKQPQTHLTLCQLTQNVREVSSPGSAWGLTFVDALRLLCTSCQVDLDGRTDIWQHGICSCCVVLAPVAPNSHSMCRPLLGVCAVFTLSRPISSTSTSTCLRSCWYITPTFSPEHPSAQRVDAFCRTVADKASL